MNRALILCILLYLSFTLLSCSDDNPAIVDYQKEEEDPGNDNPEPTNQPPIIESQPDTFVWLGETLELVAKGIDPDEDQLSYYLMDYYSTPYPEIDATIDPVTGLFSFTPKVSDVPGRTFGFVVDDGNSGCDTTYFDVIIYEDTGLEISIVQIPLGPAVPYCCYALYIDDEFIGVIDGYESTFIELDPGTYKVFVRYNLPHPWPVPQWTHYVDVVDRRTTRLVLM